MTRRWRWLIVAAGSAALVALPLAVRLLPVGHSAITAAGLLARVQASAGVQYSGYAESSGGLALPVTNRFNSINDLFGDRTQLRVWWRAADDWRVDAVNLAGETDLRRDLSGVWSWNYESNTAARTQQDTVPIVRLPRADDLVPATLARRLLSHADPVRATRLPDARIAGHDTAGLRLRTGDARSTIDHIDVWALPSSGLPVRVKIYGRGDTKPVLATTLLDLSTSAPKASETAFTPAAGAKVRYGQDEDIVAAVDQFGRSHPPAQLAGLSRRPLEVGSVGVYGQGVTLLVAVPLPPRLARTVAGQLSGTPGSSAVGGGVSVGVGPLNLFLSGEGIDDARWLLAGTVTAATLTAAAAQLPPADGFR
ncbi:MAG: transcriptional regulator [Pseudonocardiales bacterium]|nr:MAG: transcriptional regulator [Pseudonocardiales bacterium]